MSRCAWCSKFIGKNDPYWWHNVYEGDRKYKSKEVFCSAKCSHEYPYNCTAKKPDKSWVLIVIIIIIIWANS